MLRLESEHEKTQKKTKEEERPSKVILGPDDDNGEPKPEPPPKPKLKGLFEWIADLFRRGRHKPQSTQRKNLRANSCFFAYREVGCLLVVNYDGNSRLFGY